MRFADRARQRSLACRELRQAFQSFSLLAICSDLSWAGHDIRTKTGQNKKNMANRGTVNDMQSRQNVLGKMFQRIHFAYFLCLRMITVRITIIIVIIIIGFLW